MSACDRHPQGFHKRHRPWHAYPEHETHLVYHCYTFEVPECMNMVDNVRFGCINLKFCKHDINVELETWELEYRVGYSEQAWLRGSWAMHIYIYMKTFKLFSSIVQRSPKLPCGDYWRLSRGQAHVSLNPRQVACEHLLHVIESTLLETLSPQYLTLSMSALDLLDLSRPL